MSTRIVLIAILFIALTNTEYVNKKLCSHDPSQCSIHNVIVDPCMSAPGPCMVKRSKIYDLSVDFTPQFSSSNLKLSMSIDNQNTDTFGKPVKAAEKGCELTPCSVEAGTRRNMNFSFILDKDLNFGKFPVKFQLVNEEDKSQTCCFTFNVQISK